MGATGSNDLNALIKAKVIKIRAELDIKGSLPHIKKQIDLISEKLVNKPVKLKVQLDSSIKSMNHQLSALHNKLNNSSSFKPLKIKVQIDVAGSASHIKNQLKDIQKTMDDFNNKYGKTLKQIENKSKELNQALNVPTNAGVQNFNNIKKYASQLQEAERILKSKMKSGEKGLFSSFEIKDAQGNLKGFIATLEKANGVIEKVKYSWNSDKNKFQVVDRTVATTTEKMVHRSMEALKNLERELGKTGKASQNLRTEYDKLMNSGANGSLEMGAVKALERKIKDEQTSIQLNEKENALLREQKALVQDIERYQSKIKGGTKTSDDLNVMNTKLSGISNGSYSDPATKKLINDIKTEFAQLKKSYTEQIAQEKELKSAQEKRIATLRQLDIIEKSHHATEGALSKANIQEVRTLANSIKTMEQYNVVRKRMKDIDHAVAKQKVDQNISKQLDKLKHSMIEWAETTGKSTSAVMKRFEQLKRNMGSNLGQLTTETDRYIRKMKEFKQVADMNAKANSIVKQSPSQQKDFALAIKNGDIAKVKEYMKALYGADVATIKLKTDSKGVTSIRTQFASAGKTARELTHEISNVDSRLRHMGTSEVFNRNANLGIFEQLRIAMARVPVWMTAMTAFYGTINVVKKMATEIINLDKSLTELRRVASDNLSIDSVFKGAVSLSQELGNNVNDVLASVNELARTFGQFNERQLLAITRTATLMSNVSDLSAQEATESLVGTMNAFNISAEDSIRIVDALNEVDNNYAISTQQLAQGLKRSSATAKTFGVTLEESVGHITAIGAVTMESGNIIGNSLKTIYSRITTLKASESILASVGVSIRKIGEDGESVVRPVSDIIEDLSQRWWDLSDSQRQNIAVTVAGRYQLSRFLALMNNYQMSMDATETATYSQGSAMRENAEYLKSYEARINTLKNSFTELSSAVGNAVLSSGMMNIIRLLTALAGVAIKITDNFGALPVVFGAVSVLLVKMGVFNKLRNSIVRGLSEMQKSFSRTSVRATTMGTAMARSTAVAGTGFSMLGAKATAGMVKVKSAFVAMGVAVKTFSATFKAMLASTVIGLGFVALGFAIEKLMNLYNTKKQKEEELVKLNKKMVDGYRKHTDGMESLVSEYEKLSSKTTLTKNEQKEYNHIQKELAETLPTTVRYIDANGKAHMKTTAEIKHEIKAVAELSREQAKLANAKFLEDMEKKSKAYMKIIDHVEDLKKAQERLNNSDGKKTMEATFLGQKTSKIDNTKAIQQNKVEILMAEAEKTEAIKKTIKVIQGQALAYFEAQGKLITLGDEQQAVVEKFIQYNEAMLRGADTPEKFEQAYRDLFTIGTEVGDVFSDAYLKMTKNIGDDPLKLQDVKDQLSEVAKALPESFFSITDEFGNVTKSTADVKKGLMEVVNVSNRVAEGDGNWNGLVKRLQDAGLTLEQSQGLLNGLAREHDNARLRAEAQKQGVDGLTTSMEDLNQEAMQTIDLTASLFGYNGDDLSGMKSHLQAMHLLVDTMGEAGKKTKAYKDSQEVLTDFLNISASELENNKDKYYEIIDALTKVDLSTYSTTDSFDDFIQKNEDLTQSQKNLLKEWSKAHLTKDVITGANTEIIKSNEEVQNSSKDTKTKIDDIFSEPEINGVTKALDDTKKKTEDDSWITKAKNKIGSIFSGIGDGASKGSMATAKYLYDFLPPSFIEDVQKAQDKIGEFFDKLKNKTSDGVDTSSSKLKEWSNSLSDYIQPTLQGIWIAFDTSLNGVPSKLLDKFTEWSNMLKLWFDSLPEVSKTSMENWKTSLIDYFKNLPDNTRPKLEEWYTSIKSFFANLPDRLKEDFNNLIFSIAFWFESGKQKIVEKLAEWSVAITTSIVDWKDDTANSLNEWWTSIEDWFTSIPSRINSKLNEWTIAVINTFIGWKDKTIEKLDDWWTSISDWFVSIPSKIKSKLNDWSTAINDWLVEQNELNKEAYGKWGESIQDFFSSLPSKAGDKLNEFWDSITQWISEKASSWSENLSSWGNAISDWFTSLPSKINENLSSLWDSISQWFTDTTTLWGDNLSKWSDAITNWITNKAQDISDSFSSWTKAIGDWIQEKRQLWTEKLDLWRESIIDWFTSMPGKIQESLTEWTNTIIDWFTSLPGKVKGKFDTWVDNIKTWISEKKDLWSTSLSDWGKSISDWFASLPNKTSKGLSDWWNSITDWFKSTVNRWKDNLDNWWKAIGSWFNGLADHKEIKDAGKKTVDKVSEGIKEKKKDFLEKLAEVLLDAPKYIFIALGIVALAVGRELIQRIVKGVTEKLPKFLDKLSEIHTYLKNKMGEMIKTGLSKGKEIASNIADGVHNKRKEITDKFDDIKTSAVKKLKEARADLVDIAKSIPKSIGDGIKNKMKDLDSGIRSIANKLAGGIEKGINNTVIKGVNSVLGFMHIDKTVPNIKIPRYANGTKGHVGGHAIVGEEGRELAYIPNQGITVVGENGSELVDLPKGTSVLPNKQSEELLKNFFPAYAGGVGDFFSKLMDKPKDLMKKAFSKFPLDLGIDGTLADLAKGGVNLAKDGAIDFIKDKLKNFFSFSTAGIGGGKVSGSVTEWLTKAIAITGVPMSWLPLLQTMAMHESGGNPRAINLWDSNAKAGIPSKGLMQTIDPTFNAYKMSGLGDIWNPIHNAVASIRYILSRYGSIFNTPGARSMAGGGAYRGYANGGFIDKMELAWHGEEGEEAIIPLIGKRRKRGLNLWEQTGEKLGINKRAIQILKKLSGFGSSGGMSSGGMSSFGASSGESSSGVSGGGDSGSSGIVQPSIYEGGYNLDGTYQFHALASKPKPEPKEEVADAFTFNKYERSVSNYESAISKLETKLNAMKNTNETYRKTLKEIVDLEYKRFYAMRKDLQVTKDRQGYIERALKKLPALNKQNAKQRDRYNELMQEYDSNISKVNSLSNEIESAMIEIRKNQTEIFNGYIDDMLRKYDKEIDKHTREVDNRDYQLEVLSYTDPNNVKEKQRIQGIKAGDLNKKKSASQDKVDAMQKEYDKAVKETGYYSSRTDKARQELRNAQEELEDITLEVLKAEKDIKDTRAEVVDEGISQLKEYYKNMEDMAVNAIDAEKEHLQKAHDDKMKMYDEEIDKINSVYDEKIAKMDKERDQENYQSDLAEKNTRKTDLLNKISLLSRDNSLEGKKKLADLRKELEDVNKEISDFQKDRQDQLYRQSIEDQKQQQIDAINSQKEQEDTSLQQQFDSLDAEKEAVVKQYEDLLNNDKYWADMRSNYIEGSFVQLTAELYNMSNSLRQMNQGVFDGLTDSFSSFSDEVKQQVAEINGLNIDNMIYGSQTAMNGIYDMNRLENPYQFPERSLSTINSNVPKNSSFNTSQLLNRVKQFVPNVTKSAFNTIKEIMTGTNMSASTNYGDIIVNVENGDKKKGSDIAKEIMNALKKKGQ
ncbi:phage tail tape measure protein [Halobacillus rhizosphaerae]|uniref:phage tail tape measure protein n=1 Tax=Halobacillus rhizosphaerae TaxID=3064889 RepID=UPI00398B8252